MSLDTPRRSHISGIVVSFVTSVVTTLLIGLPLWNYQQKQLQEWSARPVVDFSITNKKLLSIKNVGTVEISDLSIYVTAYILRLKATSPHVILPDTLNGAGVEKIGRPTKHDISIRVGDTFSWDLEADQGLKSVSVQFYPITNDINPAMLGTQYAFRVVFRNSITKQKFVRYLITSAVEGPSMFDFSPNDAFGGDVDGANNFAGIRDAIRKNQAQLFDDLESDLYR